jgi:branched-chain amino acid transport system permease protein
MAINGTTSRSFRTRFAGLGLHLARWRISALMLLARLARLLEGAGSGLAWKRRGVAAALVLACLAPFLVSSYHLFQLTEVLFTAIALLGLNMLTGFNGQISLGHGAFYAIGAYTTAVLMHTSGVPYWATIPVAGLLCLCVGFLFGLPALRLEGLYLALATFALAVAMPQLLKFKYFDHWTGGVQGIIIDKPDPPTGLPIDSDQWLYFFCLAVTVPMFVIGWNLLRGRTGRAMVAIREHPIAASTMGIDTALYKSATFGVSAMYTGVAGALGAVVTQFVAPDSFPVFLSINFLVGLVVGGIRSIPGAFAGAVFIVLVPNIADQISKAAPGAINGIFLIGFMYLMPLGIAGFIRLLWGRLGRLAKEGERLTGEGKRT